MQQKLNFLRMINTIIYFSFIGFFNIVFVFSIVITYGVFNMIYSLTFTFCIIPWFELFMKYVL